MKYDNGKLQNDAEYFNVELPLLQESVTPQMHVDNYQLDFTF